MLTARAFLPRPVQHEMEPKAGSKRREKDEGDREKCFQCKRDARKGDAMVYCEVCQWGEWPAPPGT